MLIRAFKSGYCSPFQAWVVTTFKANLERVNMETIDWKEYKRLNTWAECLKKEIEHDTNKKLDFVIKVLVGAVMVTWVVIK